MCVCVCACVCVATCLVCTCMCCVVCEYTCACVICDVCIVIYICACIYMHDHIKPASAHLAVQYELVVGSSPLVSSDERLESPQSFPRDKAIYPLTRRAITCTKSHTHLMHTNAYTYSQQTQ